MSHMDRSLVALLFLTTAATDAHAVITQRLKDACRSEYYAYCSAHELGSEGLSQGCLQEMVAAGEVSQAEIKAYNARKHR